MKENELEWRMYGLVPYNLSPIQQGIQFGHALQEYNNRFLNEFINTDIVDSDKNSFYKWRVQDKTFIILNGGTTNAQVVKKDEGGLTYVGSLDNHAYSLESNNVSIVKFCEPDLNNALTAVVFLVDERVFDKKKYPDLPELTEGDLLLGGEFRRKRYELWVESIGGEKNVWLREFLSQFRLA